MKIYEFNINNTAIKIYEHNITNETFKTSNLVKLLEIIIDNKMLLLVKCVTFFDKKLRNSKTRINTDIFSS